MISLPLPTSPPTPIASGGRCWPLEALRGIAALGVLASHLIHHITQLAPNSPGGYIAHLGREWVIIFFVLSGVVNTLAVEARPCDGRGFLVRRLRRLVPLYLVGCAAGWLIDTLSGLHSTSWVDVAACLFFFADPVLYGLPEGVYTNAPIWSLTYEFWFYVFFALTIRPNSKVWMLWTGGAMLAAVAIPWIPLPSAARSLASICAYSLCWLWGSLLVRQRHRFTVSPAFIGGAFAVGMMARPLQLLPGNLDLYRHLWLALWLGPLFLGLMGRNSCRTTPTLKELGLLAVGAAAAAIALATRDDASKTSQLLGFCLPAAGLVAGLTAGWVIRMLGDWIDGAPRHIALGLGRYSYSLYILHMPPIYLAALLLPPSCFLPVILVTLPALAWWGEARLHPALLRAFDHVRSLRSRAV